MTTATFGAGCFWGVETSFRKIDGVTATAVGYAGGHAANPTYEQVCGGGTGHAEVVKVDYDPVRVSYDDLLSVFWMAHDPTQVNRQGPDVGSQYRSLILSHDDEQATAARQSKEALAVSGRHALPVATEIGAAGDFWLAEDYHQQFFEKRGMAHGGRG